MQARFWRLARKHPVLWGLLSGPVRAGSETHAFSLEVVCAEGIKIELQMGEGSSHFPDYRDTFISALVARILSKEQLPASAGRLN